MLKQLFTQKAKSKRLKVIFTFYFLLFTFCNISSPVFALEFDTSLDDEIRKNYNPNKIEKDMQLPALPRVFNEKPASTTTVVNSKPDLTPIKKPIEQAQTQPQTLSIRKQQSSISQKQPVAKLSAESYATLKYGTKIKVRSLSTISDKTKKSTRVSFVSTYPVSATYFTIPAGTVFKGEVINSHRPQFTSNGGLIKIKVNSVILNGQTQALEACITKANHKKIFQNNIKGKRKYLSNMFKSTKPGCHFCKKMIRVTAYLASDGSSIIIAPFSFIAGFAAVAGNIIVSPVLATFKKGGSIAINEGSDFEIKLIQDMYIYK